MWGYCLKSYKIIWKFPNLDIVKNSVDKFYNTKKEGIENSKDYGRIVNENNFKRVETHLKDAIKKGAKVEYGGKLNEKEKFIEPTLLTNITLEMMVMQEEIFGPILPVLTYEKNNEVIELFQKMPSPLAIYIMSSDKKNIKFFIIKF